MARFRIRQPAGGSALRGGDSLRGPDPYIAAAAAAQASASGALSTEIRLSGAAAAQASAAGTLATAITLVSAAPAQASATGALTDYIVPTPTPHAIAVYEQYLRVLLDAGAWAGTTFPAVPGAGIGLGAGGPIYRLGTVAGLRDGAWHVAAIADFSSPQDNALDDFGIQQGGGFSVDLVSTEDLALDLVGFGAALRGRACELELVTKLLDDAGTVIEEIVHRRRAVVKSAAQRKSTLTLAIADVDREALDAVFPFETYSVEDWPEIFVDHVGRRVAQGVGTVVRVPLTWVKKTGGAHRWAGPKVIGSVGTLLAVYRGDSPGRGALVSASEYSAGTMVAAITAGLTVATVDFTREQVDFGGRPYVLEADYLLPGSRQPADEIARLLALFGVGTDPVSFIEAANYDAAAGFAIDALYGADNGRTGNAIVEDLLRVARGWLVQTETGAWAIVQDRPKIPVMAYDAEDDQIDVEEYVEVEVEKTVTIEYRPRRSGVEDFEGRLARDTGGSSGELRVQCPYVRDHSVADRLSSYHQKRLASLRRATASMYAAQLAPGSLISIAKEMTWRGEIREFIVEATSRPAHRNGASLREYVADVYVYTAGALPAGATNTYGPDYSFTPSVAPTGLTVVSQGTSVDNDGKVTAYALIRATPPAVNWSRLMVQVKDTTTNEIYQAQLLLASGNYEATVAGLRPNRAHTVVAWAVNPNNLDGAATAAVNFTSANYMTAPAAPTGMAAAQGSAKTVRVSCAAPTVAGFSEIIWFRKVGAGSYAEYRRSKANFFIDENVSYGTTYYYKAQVVVLPANPSADSAEVNVTPTTNISDSDIPSGGVSGVSIANGSINRGRSYTGTGSASGTISAATGLNIAMDLYTFFPNFRDTTGVSWLNLNASLGASADTGSIGINNTSAGSAGYSVTWRNFLA